MARAGVAECAEAIDMLREDLELDWFGQIVMRSQTLRLQAAVEHAARAEDQNAGGGEAFTELRNQRQSARIGQAEVEQDKVGRRPAQGCPHRVCAGADHNMVAALGQEVGDLLGVRYIIFDN